MKRLFLSLLLLLSTNSVSANSEIKDVYAYIGAGLGKTWLNTSVATDKGDKDGNVTNFMAFATYYNKSWMGSLGFGYYDLFLENDATDITYTKLITETFYIDLVPEYRVSKRFSVGLSYQHLVGEEFLGAPTAQLNVNDEQTSKSLAGLVVHYDIPFKSFRIRTGLSVHKALSLGARSAYLGLLTVQFGTAIYDSDYNEQPKVIYKYRDREVIKTIPAEIIELGEQVINFKTGSYRLSTKSAKFVEKVAELLSNNLDDWEIVRIVGHTDIVGFEKANQLLSERRAESVKNILINSGLSRERIFYLGFGESRLKSKGTTATDHKTNRRVELQFIGHLNKSFADKVKELVSQERQ